MNNNIHTDKELLGKLTRILDQNDLVGVIAMCSSHGFDVSGEYQPEAEAILQRQNQWESVDQLQQIISEDFDNYFYNPDISDKRYQKAARDIWNAWLIHQGLKPEIFADNIVLPAKNKSITIYLD